MINLTYFTFSALLFLTFACQKESTSSQQVMDEKLAFNNEAIGERPPEVFPAMHPLVVKALQSENNWHVVDQYYRDSLHLEKEKPYYDNLQFYGLLQLFSNDDFLANAPDTTLEYYFNALTSRSVINRPDLIFEAMLKLKSLNRNIDDVGLAQNVIQINMEYYGTNWRIHQKKYQNAYSYFAQIGLDRWGAPK